ncbi:MAG: biotin--[acetyl-CoA-carboxylase] ligase [Bacteroidetes bacterium]|nr:biotin--[acetyl-CoA-carboxylase] ligase [Bacteroidota bacterium]
MFTNQIKWTETIDSTNNEAVRNLQDAPHGSVWAARFQTDGRGQRGNQWESAVGENLIFSLLLRPKFLPAERQFLISEISALAVCDLLISWGLDARIKWPNDIYAGDKKIQGMLIEHFLSGTRLSASVVGIGLNLNQEHFGSNAPNPSSVWLETGIRQEPEKALKELLEFLHTRYEALQAGNWSSIEAAYQSKLYRRDQWATYLRSATGGTFEGCITGVDACGRLKMDLKEGKKECFAFKEVGYCF